MKLDIRHGVNPFDFRSYDTGRLRNDFLITRLFVPGEIRMTYSHIDRIITGGACPTIPLPLECGREIGTEFFLQRREMGIINVGATGTVIADGERFVLKKMDGLYLGAGNKNIVFESENNDDHAHFYFSSAPAHTSHPNCYIDIEKAKKVKMGEPEKANVRTINQYIHPEVCSTCQLMMGLTQLENGSVWNTMPCHTHERRMEVIFTLTSPRRRLRSISSASPTRPATSLSETRRQLSTRAGPSTARLVHPVTVSSGAWWGRTRSSPTWTTFPCRSSSKARTANGKKPGKSSSEDLRASSFPFAGLLHPHGVQDHRYGAEGHGPFGNHGVEQGAHGEGYGHHVVGKGPEEILADHREGLAGNGDGIGEA